MQRIGRVLKRAAAIRITNGDFFALWTMWAGKVTIPDEPAEISRDTMLCAPEEIWSETAEAPGKTIKADVKTINDTLLPMVKCYERNGISDEEDDRDIFLVSGDELATISDALRDGDYVFNII